MEGGSSVSEARRFRNRGWWASLTLDPHYGYVIPHRFPLKAHEFSDRLKRTKICSR
jgi:hypothetical protein